jgi:hypothetical protein
MYSEAMHARKKDWSVQNDRLGFLINESITCVAMSDLHIPEFFNHMKDSRRGGHAACGWIPLQHVSTT